MAVAGAIVLALTAIAAVFRTVLGFELLDPTGLIVILVLLAVMLAISVPVGFALGIAAFGYGYLTGSVPPSSVPSTMLDSVNNFILLALPFFIFAGFIMTTGGLSRPMAEFVRMLIGRVRGGLLHVVIVSMYLFSGMSGSKLADVAAVGSTLKDVLRQAGYEPEETAAVLAASAAMGETVPPSIAMIVLGSITSLSIGALFAAGLVPAALIAACLMVIVWLRAGKFPTAAAPQWSRRVVVATTARAVPAFVLPVILVTGIVTGVATPTEVSTVAVAYGLVVALLYRTLGLRNFWGLATQTATMAGMILFILSTASAFSWMLAIADVPQSIAALLNSLPGGGWVFLLASIAAVTAMGALLEGLPALLIFGPLLLPVAVRVGVNPLQYGIVLIISMGIGAFAPPLGIGAYVACSVADADLARTTRAAAPYMIALAVGVVLIAIVPGLSLALPDALHLAP
ncbi:MAG: TRAP transporter large permease [Candidatus Dormibacteraceae bacterium]